MALSRSLPSLVARWNGTTLRATATVLQIRVMISRVSLSLSSLDKISSSSSAILTKNGKRIKRITKRKQKTNANNLNKNHHHIVTTAQKTEGGGIKVKTKKMRRIKKSKSQIHNTTALPDQESSLIKQRPRSRSRPTPTHSQSKQQTQQQLLRKVVDVEQDKQKVVTAIVRGVAEVFKSPVRMGLLAFLAVFTILNKI